MSINLCDEVDMMEVVMLSASLAKLTASSCWSPSPFGRGPRSSTYYKINLLAKTLKSQNYKQNLASPICNTFFW